MTHSGSLDVDGFILLRGVLDRRALARLKEELDESLDPIRSGAATCCYYEPSRLDRDARILRRIERISDHLPGVRDLVYSPDVLRLLETSTGEPYLLFKDKLNLKLPGGSAYPPHIDGHFWWRDASRISRRGWLEYGTDFVTLVIPLDAATRRNGCLEICPKDYTLRHLGRSWEEITARLREGRGPDLDVESLPPLPLRGVEMQPGDILLFSWLNVHGSEVNLSTCARRVLFLTYAPTRYGSQRVRYYEDKDRSSDSASQKVLLR